MSYLTTEHVASHSHAELDRLAALWARAKDPAQARAVRLLDLGDSRSTCPYGAGSQVCPLFAYLWAREFGNAPETPLTPPLHFGGAGHLSNAEGGILMGCACVEGFETQQTSPHIAHGMEGSLPFALTPDDEYGPNYCLQHDFYETHVGPRHIPRSVEYLRRLDHRCEIFVPRLPAQHTVIRWVQGEQPSTATNYFSGTTLQTGTIATAGTTSVQGDAASCLGPEGPVRSYLTPPAAFSVKPSTANLHSLYARWRIGSNSSAMRLNVLGVVIRSANTRGFGYTTSAAGGRMVTSVLSECPLSFHTWRAYAPSVVTALYGANDAGNGYSPAGFASGAAALTTWIKANLLDERGQVPLVIFEAAPLMAGVPATQIAAMSQYADALADLARQVPGVIALNTARRAAEMGYTPGTHTTDGVHYNTAGALTVAAARHNLWHAAVQRSQQFPRRG